MQNGRFREETGFLGPKPCGMDARVCWSVTPAGGAFHRHASNDTRYFSVARIFPDSSPGTFCCVITDCAVQFYGKELVFPRRVPNSSQ